MYKKTNITDLALTKQVCAITEPELTEYVDTLIKIEYEYQ